MLQFIKVGKRTKFRFIVLVEVFSTNKIARENEVILFFFLIGDTVRYDRFHIDL